MEATLHKPNEYSSKATHLCVLVHGLWGNGSHLNYLADSLRNKYNDGRLALLVCQRNASSFTYDGIEVGGERVTKEIEDTLDELEREGHNITRFSIIGYSLGGLVARYAIGLLYHKGYFDDRLTPVNFTTFATPHLGARSALIGYTNYLWNVLGARTLSASGKQLFVVDNFRDSGRPLLSILADPESIFIHALALFKNRCLYTNIVNDKTVGYYTSAITKFDPYADLSKIKINYLEGYDDVLLDPDEPYQIYEEQETPTLYESLRLNGKTFLQKAPLYMGLSVLLPVAVVLFLINSGIQTIRSRKRILLHEQDTDDEGPARYRVSWLVQDMRARIEDIFEATNSAHQPSYLPEGSVEGTEEDLATPRTVRSRSSASEKLTPPTLRRMSTSTAHPPDFPTLALNAAQFGMIKSLDNVGIRKYPVHIHNSTHSHAAIIVRGKRKAFDEGKVVVRHWLEQAFVI